MISWGPGSRRVYAELHGSLQKILDVYADEATHLLDITLTCGFRGEAEQNRAFNEGKSEKPWPTSGHNRQPAVAVDIANAGGFPLYDKHQLAMRQGALRLIAARLRIPLKPLISWDLPHLELKL